MTSRHSKKRMSNKLDPIEFGSTNNSVRIFSQEILPSPTHSSALECLANLTHLRNWHACMHAYGGENEYQTMKVRLDEVEWTKRFQFYRAVEEYAYPVIVALFKHRRVQRWLESKIEDYTRDTERLLHNIADKDVRQFLATHAKGAYRHMRGGALNCTIVDLIPEFVRLRRTSYSEIPNNLITQVLAKADGYLNEIKQVNLESIGHISERLETGEQLQRMIFDHQPKYLQEIVLAVKQWKQQANANRISIPSDLPIRVLEPYFQRKHYQYWSRAENNLRGSNATRHNIMLRKYFGFTLVQIEDGMYLIRFSDTSKMIGVQ